MAFNPNSLANLKPIKKGEVRNPTGMTKELSERIRRTADKVTRMQELQADAVVKLLEDLEAQGRHAEIAEFVKSDYNTFARDVMDRAFGKAQQSLDLSSADGSMSPRQEESEAVLAALKRKHDPDA